MKDALEQLQVLSDNFSILLSKYLLKWPLFWIGKYLFTNAWLFL